MTGNPRLVWDAYRRLIAGFGQIVIGVGAAVLEAGVVAREFGKVCLVSCDSLRIDLARRVAYLGEHEFREGERLTLDGNSGAIYEGAVRTVSEAPAGLLARLAALRATPGG